MQIRVPKWVAVLPIGEPTRVLEAFRAFLRDLSLTRSELGRRLDLGPATVRGWANGSQRPSLESMKASVHVVRDALAELRERADQMQQVLDLVDADIAAHDVHHAEPTKESLDALLAASHRLSSTLDAMGVPMEESE